MFQRIVCCILCAVMTITCFPISAKAQDIKYSTVQIDAGSGVQAETAIIEDDEIYIAASSFSKYTRYQYDDEKQTFVVAGQDINKAFKKVVVNAEMMKAVVGTEQIDLINCFIVNGEVFLPFTQMLPILNADILDINSGVIYIVNNKLSMAELLYDFDINEYAFNISEEFFNNNALALAYIVPSYLFDSVVNFRFDRLDVIYKTGDYNDYRDIFSSYLKDDELFLKATSNKDVVGTLLQSVIDINSTTEKLNNVYEWFDKIEETENSVLDTDVLVEFIKKTSVSDTFDDELETMVKAVHDDEAMGASLADMIKYIDYIYTYLTHVEDHQIMLDAVYDVASNIITVDPAYKAAKKIYDLYGEHVVRAVAEEAAMSILKKAIENTAEYKTFGLYKLTAEAAGEILELYLPGDSGDRSQLMLHANIVTSSRSKAVVPTLDTEKSTNSYRLSLLLTLIASRACYEIMAETADGYGQDSTYYQEKIERIENMIMGLYLVAGNVAFDTYENYKEFAETNRQLIVSSGILQVVNETINGSGGESAQEAEDNAPEPTSPPTIQTFSANDFNETYWFMATGVTNGSFYRMLFHSDGTYEGINYSGSAYITGTYSYKNGSLWVYNNEFGDAEYQYSAENEKFESVELFQMQSVWKHRSLSPDSSGSLETEFNNLVLSRRPVFSDTDWSNRIFLNDIPNKTYDSYIENGGQPYAIEMVGNCDFTMSLSGMDDGKTVAVVIFNNKEEVISQNYYCGNDSVIEIPDVSAGTIFYILVCSENQAAHYTISWSTEESASKNTTVISTKYIVNVANSVYFRSSPEEIDGNVLATIPLNEEVGFIEETDSVFSRIQYTGEYGYVKSIYLGDERDTPESDAVGTAVSAYADFLATKVNDAYRFQLTYIDDDNIPELLVSAGNFHAAGVVVYSYDNSGVVESGVVGSWGAMQYGRNTGVIISNYVGMGAISNDFYSLKNGDISLICSVGSFQDWAGSEETTYTINGNNVSQQEYQHKLDQMLNSDEFIEIGYGSGWDVSDETVSQLRQDYTAFLSEQGKVVHEIECYETNWYSISEGDIYQRNGKYYIDVKILAQPTYKIDEIEELIVGGKISSEGKVETISNINVHDDCSRTFEIDGSEDIYLACYDGTYRAYGPSDFEVLYEIGERTFEVSSDATVMTDSTYEWKSAFGEPLLAIDKFGEYLKEHGRVDGLAIQLSHTNGIVDAIYVIWHP